MNPEERRHVQQYVGRAKLFIANINQRRQTLFNITRCLVDQQREFLERGDDRVGRQSDNRQTGGSQCKPNGHRKWS